ncbi:MAG: amidohydrolase/deacetylase family metallohydrolase [Desulfobacteraceae bacterium]|jgi:dihydroorotase
MDFDLILKNGTVIDPAQGLYQKKDVAIKDGNIAALNKRIDDHAAQVIDASGKLIVPGLIDLHTHVYWGGTSLGIQPEKILARSGVTTWVDAGSTGAGNFIGFKEHVIETSRVRILPFLNIGFAGIFGYMSEGPEDTSPTWVGELSDVRLANLNQAVGMAEKFTDLIVGIKIRSGIDGSCDFPGLEPVLIAKKAAEEVGKPLMVHIGYAPPTTRELLPFLRKGDILTHAFRGDPNSLLDGRGKIIPEVKDARQREVVLDLGHGAGSFSFDTARRMMAQGIEPDVISSDIHAASVNGPAYDLPTTMSKMLNLGMRLDNIIRAATYHPAKAIGYEKELGSLRVGTVGDITVLELQEGEFLFQDCFNSEIKGQKRLVPSLTILAGKILNI